MSSYETSFDDLVDAMNAALLAMDPEARTVPYMLSGGTDAKAFAKLGIRCWIRPAATAAGTGLLRAVPRRGRTGAGDALQFGARVLEHLLKNC